MEKCTKNKFKNELNYCLVTTERKILYLDRSYGEVSVVSIVSSSAYKYFKVWMTLMFCMSQGNHTLV